MAHKVNPKLFRLKRTKDWDSKGFYEKDFSKYLEEDFVIRQFLDEKIGDCGVARIKIKRSLNTVEVIIYSMRPGLIIGRGGEGINKLREDLLKRLIRRGVRKREKKEDPRIKLEVKEVRDPWSNASLVAQWMADQIEKRVHYRTVLKKALGKIMGQKGIKGAKVQVSGRLNGISIARTEWLREGLLPRQTIRADIDYFQDKALCSYGVVGIKVWIYQKENKLEKQKEK